MIKDTEYKYAANLQGTNKTNKEEDQLSGNDLRARLTEMKRHSVSYETVQRSTLDHRQLTTFLECCVALRGYKGWYCRGWQVRLVRVEYV